MSKQATLTCKIKQVDVGVLKKAMEHLVKLKDGTLKLIDQNHIDILCRDLGYYHIHVQVVNGQLEISGEANEVEKAKAKIEKFYTAMMIEETQGSPVHMDKNGDLLLTVEV